MYFFPQVLQVYCPGWVCNTTGEFSERDEVLPAPRKRYGKAKVQMQMFNDERHEGVSLWNDEEQSPRRDVKFDLNNSDVLVFLHIQKTGGTVFGRNMVKSLYDPSTGRNACSCRPEAKRYKWNQSLNYLFLIDNSILLASQNGLPTSHVTIVRVIKMEQLLQCERSIPFSSFWIWAPKSPMWNNLFHDLSALVDWCVYSFRQV